MILPHTLPASFWHSGNLQVYNNFGDVYWLLILLPVLLTKCTPERSLCQFRETFPSGSNSLLFSIMQEVVLQINELEEKQRVADRSLRSYAGQLGRIIAHQSALEEVSPALRDEYLMREEELKKTEEEKRLVSELIQAQREGQKARDGLKDKKKVLEDEIQQLRIRLGAIFFEQAQSDSCDPAVRDSLSIIISRYQKLKDNTQNGSFFSSTASKLLLAVSNQNKDFLAAFNAVEQGNLFSFIQGDRAQSLISEYLGKVENLNRIESELSKLNEDITDADKLRENHAKEIESKLSQCRTDEEAAAVSYGIYLFDNAVKWLKDDTANPIVDIVSDMLKTQEIIEENALQIKLKKTQIEVYNQMEKVRLNEKAIMKLESERERLLSQINDLKAENETIITRVRNLERGVEP
ncbi:MAG: hypothetical protein K6G51_03605 [Sphaerochaetaceae bacterium]|nr:hypothetical protein [Sphaerochaetaceae bacterium]